MQSIVLQGSGRGVPLGLITALYKLLDLDNKYGEKLRELQDLHSSSQMTYTVKITLSPKKEDQGLKHGGQMLL